MESKNHFSEVGIINAQKPFERKGLWSKWPVKLILLTGLLVGTLDISAACTDFYFSTGKNPVIVLRYVASGVFGRKAFTGGEVMIIWGLFFHFLIAYCFTIFFCWIYPKMQWFRRYPVLSAFLYGLFMWVVTTQIVLPLSNTPPAPPFIWWKALKAICILVLMISLPLTLIISRRYQL